MATTERTPLLKSSKNSPKNVSVGRYMKATYFSVVACFGGLQFGYALLFSSPLLDNLKDLTDYENFTLWKEGFRECVYQELIGPMMPIGAIIGSLLSFVVVAFTGLVTGMVIPVFFSILGWAMMGGSYAVTEGVTFRAMVLSAQFFNGFAAGWQAGIVPGYIAEISPAHVRGKLGSLFESFIAVGGLLCQLCGSFIDYWKLAFLFSGLSFLHLILLFTIEEPRSRNIFKKISQVSKSCRSNEIIASRNICKAKYAWRIVVVVFIMILQPGIGINTVVAFMGPIFESVGIGREGPLDANEIAALCFGVVAVIATFSSIFVVDRFGRRVSLFFGSLGLFVGMLLLTAYYGVVIGGIVELNTTQPRSNTCDLFPEVPIKDISMASKLSPLAIVGLVIYVASFSLSWGPVPWILAGEIFPDEVRTLGGGVGVAANWSTTVLLAFLFPVLSIAIGETVPFLLFALTSFLSALFVIFFIPETKGLSLEESSNIKFSISRNVKEFFLLMKDCVKCCRINCKYRHLNQDSTNSLTT